MAYTVRDLASKMSSLMVVGENLTEEERASFISSFHHNQDDDVEFEFFLRVSFTHLSIQYNSLDQILKTQVRNE